MQIASGRPAFTPMGTRATVVAGIAAALALTVGPACRRAGRAPSPADTSAADAGAAPRVIVAGQVVDRRRQPVPEARILLFPVERSDGASETATDSEGRFRVSGLPAGPYRLIVEAAGFPTAERAPVPAPGDGVSVVLDDAGKTIVGRVERAGAPAAGVRVLLAPDDGGPVREASTRAGGGFAFGGLGAARYALRAVGDEAASAVARAVEAREGTGGAPVVLTLEPARALAGRVLDDAGAGLGRVEVRAEGAAGPVVDDPLAVVARTDASGRYSVGPLGAGVYRLSAARPGYLLRRAPKVEVRLDTAPAPIDLELVRGARLTGRIRDGAGASAAGARVRCSASAIEDLTVQTGPLPLAAEAAALPSGAGRALGSTRLVVADRDGRFTVDDLIPGRYRVEIAQPGAEPFRSDDFVLAPGERRDLGLLELRAGIVVQGRVIDESGAPIEGARVAVSSAGAAAAPPASAMTDGSGRFALTLPAGSWRIAASAPGRGGGGAPVELRTGAAAPTVELKLRRAEARLEGLVRDDGGRPVARARIVVFPPEAAGSPVGSGTADVGGHFTISSLPAGDLRLEIQHPDYPTTTSIASGGQYALVTVPFPGGVAGEVRARSTGAAVGRARVDAVGPGGATASADLRKSSSFTLMPLVPGRWRLTVTAPGFRPAERELDVAAAAALREPSLRDLRVELDPG